MTTRTKPRATRSSKPIATPSVAQIREKLEPLQQTPMTPAQADAVLAKNGVPPAESWSQAAAALWRCCWRLICRATELFGTATVAVACPLLTAAVDGLGLVVAGVTVWELWRPAVALADALVARFN
jgi:hypothetical protein